MSTIFSPTPAAEFSQGQLQAIANNQGCPAAWISGLVRQGCLCPPVLPGASASDELMVAFPVRIPVMQTPPAGHKRICDHLRTLGHCQGSLAHLDGPWDFVPASAVAPLCGTEGIRGMEPLIFMGTASGVRFLVVAEGWWNAVTFAGAMGWLDHETALPAGAAVLGVRGDAAVDLLLTFWAEWLFSNRPTIHVESRNENYDPAWGTRVIEPPLPLAEELKRITRRYVGTARTPPRLGQDFRDHWRKAPGDFGDLAIWLRRCGYQDASGRWTKRR